jgi:hypothetical protein
MEGSLEEDLFLMDILQAWWPQNVSIVSGRGDGLCSSRRKMK